jgi:hypothetical protein
VGPNRPWLRTAENDRGVRLASVSHARSTAQDLVRRFASGGATGPQGVPLLEGAARRPRPGAGVFVRGFLELGLALAGASPGSRLAAPANPSGWPISYNPTTKRICHEDTPLPTRHCADRVSCGACSGHVGRCCGGGDDRSRSSTADRNAQHQPATRNGPRGWRRNGTWSGFHDGAWRRAHDGRWSRADDAWLRRNESSVVPSSI